MAKVIPFSKPQHLSNLARKSSLWIAYLLITALIMRSCTGPVRAQGVVPQSAKLLPLPSGDTIPLSRPNRVDTLAVPVFEKSDTVKVTLIYMAPDGNVKHSDGNVIVKGFKMRTPKGWEWVDQEQTMSIYDTKYKPFPHPILNSIPKTKGGGK